MESAADETIASGSKSKEGEREEFNKLELTNGLIVFRF